MCSSLARNSCRTTFMFRKLPRCNTHCPCAELAIGFEPRNNVPNSRTEQDYDGAAPLAHKLLSDRSFHIEFGGFLTNHVKHAVVALEGLGASAELIQRYWDWYTTLIPNGPLLPAERPSGEEVKAESLDELLGQKQRFTDLHSFFSDEVRREGIKTVVQRYAPMIAPGAAGGLMHGIIHLGWAVDANNPDMVAEGMAYMVYTFVSVHPERFKRSLPEHQHPIDSLISLLAQREQESVRASINAIKSADKYSKDSGFHFELVPAHFQREVAKVLEEGNPLVSESPGWLYEAPVDTILEQLHRVAAALHVAASGHDGAQPSRDANFIVLHVVTALWGVDRVLSQLDDEATKLAVLQCFWGIVAAILLTMEAPLSSALLSKLWGKLVDTEGSWVDASDAEQRWGIVKERAFDDDEEHNMKLAYVEHQLSRRYSNWEGFLRAAETFTDPPNVSPGAVFAP